MKWKECGRKEPWPNFRYYLGIFLEGLRTTMKICHNSQSPGKHLNLDPHNTKQECYPLNSGICQTSISTELKDEQKSQ
jgi:hypothetical protein